MSLFLELARALVAPFYCRLGWHREYDAEIDVPCKSLPNGWFLPFYGAGTPVHRCAFCGRERRRLELK